MTQRLAGVLLHPTSLPGNHGVGDFGPQAEAFLSWAADAGFRLWQVLPLHPSAVADSPYSALSAFALDPLFISLERLRQEGLLAAADLPAALENSGVCDYRAARRLKAPLLRRAWERFRQRPGKGLDAAFDAFRNDPLHAVWLEDWCLFVALRSHLGQGGWWTWPEPLRRRREAALARYRHELADAIDYERFLQFCAFRHWQAVRDGARNRGITILGDVPIYVAHDSAEVWAQPHLFELDDEGHPLAVAGVPPDYYAEDGQLWGNPLYRWQALADDGYDWWIDRLRGALALADLLRLDHFRAFADYWRIPADAATARQGSWQDGPGKALFDALAEHLPTPLPLMAEDLGDLSDKVHALRRAVGLPSMKVLHFAFDGADSDHAPFRLTPDTLLYTGTHDNDTSLGWYRRLDADVQARVRAFLGGSGDDLPRQIIRAAMTSVARWAVVPMQDVLGLDSAARMNVPGVAEGNWRWRLRQVPSTDETAWLRPLIDVSGRLL